MLDFLSLLWDKDWEVPNKGWIVLAFTNLADLKSAQSSYWAISNHLVFQLQGSALRIQLVICQKHKEHRAEAQMVHRQEEELNVPRH